MSISTAIRDVAGVTVVDLSGRITLGEASGKLRETVRNLLDSGVTKMVLNLAQVSYNRQLRTRRVGVRLHDGT